jgi:hypothetical protein
VRLLIGDADQLGQLLLGEPEHDATFADSSTHVIVDRRRGFSSFGLCHTYSPHHSRQPHTDFAPERLHDAKTSTWANRHNAREFHAGFNGSGIIPKSSAGPPPKRVVDINDVGDFSRFAGASYFCIYLDAIKSLRGRLQSGRLAEPDMLGSGMVAQEPPSGFLAFIVNFRIN